MEDELLEQVNHVLHENGFVGRFEELVTTWLMEDFMTMYPCIKEAYHKTHSPPKPAKGRRRVSFQDSLAFYLKEGYRFEDFLKMVPEFKLWPTNLKQLMGVTGELEQFL
ncbi:hypothetical protein [Alicyclobacillus sp. SO9]|uniref:hypothetical protein n=1 Tax=Alicyclobacillus sp. SO9 TaxID=2665646 RepID=UPI0018E8E3FD|nr:hypothetical protein [Alicyclobacillus sp. SO9]QQE80397.1 hypothetical protein GI364_08260 [Alicyclobacillus sp. SO9]